MSPRDDLELLRVDVETSFVQDEAGRLVATNDPDRSPAPRLYLAACAGGTVVRTRTGVEGLGLLGGADAARVGLTYVLPDHVAYSAGTALVRSGTPEGDRLVARIAEGGMPLGLGDLGFATVGEFWEPWCVALDGEEVASICFAARLGPRGAEAGVATPRMHRGRGYAAAATAGWAAHPALEGRALFYSTSPENVSSQRVAARLGLRMLGTSVAVP